MRQRHIGPCTKCTPPALMHCSCKKCQPMLNCLLYALMHAWVCCLSSTCAFSICSFVPFSLRCSTVRKDAHGALPTKSSVSCSCCSSNFSCSNFSWSSNFDTDAPSNSIAVFADVQSSAPDSLPAAAEFVIFAAALEITSILPTLL